MYPSLLSKLIKLQIYFQCQLSTLTQPSDNIIDCITIFSAATQVGGDSARLATDVAPPNMFQKLMEADRQGTQAAEYTV